MGVPVRYVGVGPGREELIVRDEAEFPEPLEIGVLTRACVLVYITPCPLRGAAP